MKPFDERTTEDMIVEVTDFVFSFVVEEGLEYTKTNLEGLKFMFMSLRKVPKTLLNTVRAIFDETIKFIDNSAFKRATNRRYIYQNIYDGICLGDV